MPGLTQQKMPYVQRLERLAERAERAYDARLFEALEATVDCDFHRLCARVQRAGARHAKLAAHFRWLRRSVTHGTSD